MAASNGQVMDLNFINSLLQKAWTLSEVERFYTQKAKCNYLREGDRCTKFFHDMAKQNYKRNSIVSFCMVDGEFSNNIEEVAKEFVGHFSGLLSSASACEDIDLSILALGPSLSTEHCDFLVADISLEEIKSSQFDIGDDKAPMPDG